MMWMGLHNMDGKRSMISIATDKMFSKGTECRRTYNILVFYSTEMWQKPDLAMLHVIHSVWGSARPFCHLSATMLAVLSGCS